MLATTCQLLPLTYGWDNNHLTWCWDDIDICIKGPLFILKNVAGVGYKWPSWPDYSNWLLGHHFELEVAYHQ